MSAKLTARDVKYMRRAGKTAALLLRKLQRYARAGTATKEIETLFDKLLAKCKGMQAAFKGFSGYPASLCVSLNDEVIHGIPSQRVIQPGDLVSLDLGIKYQDLFVDTAISFIIDDGKNNQLANKLISVAKKALQEGIKQAFVGSCIGNIGHAIQQCVEAQGMAVIRKFVGHGIGRDLHMPPEVPNFGVQGQGPVLEEGMAIAIEPMISAGTGDVEVLADGWTARTKDRSLSAHCEHTVVITKKGPIIVTK